MTLKEDTGALTSVASLQFSKFEMLFTVPAHILMTHPHLIFISPRFMLHSNLCQEGLLQVVKSEKVEADGLLGHFSLKLFCALLRENVKDFFEVSCAA